MNIGKLRIWLAALLVMVLAGCGGGGGGTDAGTPTLGGGTGGTLSPTLALALSSSDVTAASPATLTVTVRDAAGKAVPDIVVALTTSGGKLANLSVASVRTGADGTATAQVLAAGADSGADEILATATLVTTTLTASKAFTVAGSVPTLQLTLAATTLRGATGPVALTATARNAAGVLVPDALIRLDSVGGQISLSAPSVRTNAAGQASSSMSVVDPSLTVAESVRARWVNDAGETIAEQVAVVQTLADTPTITLVSSATTVTPLVPANLSIQVRDYAGQPAPAGTVVTISSKFGLTAFDATSTVTNANGLAQVLVAPKTDTSNGADQIEVTTTVDRVTAKAAVTLQVTAVASTSISVVVSPTTFSAAAPATVTVTARDARGNAVSGVVVDLSTVRGSLARLGVSSVATGANGTATTTLTAVGAGIGGADQVVGSAQVGAATLQASAGFTVSGSVATLTLTPAASTIRASDGAVNLSAVVRDATGAAVANVPVSFGSLGAKLRLSGDSALTDATGRAQVTMVVADAAVTAAETLTARVTVGGVVLQATSPVQLISALPTLTVTASSTDVSAINPATLSVLVKDAAGNPVGAGTIVSLASTFGLTGFDASTALTNASGVARFTLTPRTAGSSGADQLVATVTVGGFSATAQATLQVLSTGATSVSVAVSPSDITGAAPGQVTVTVRDNLGNGIPGTVVDLSTVKGTLAAFSVGSVLTDTNGTASTTLLALSAGASGADEVQAVARIGSQRVTGSVGFKVQGSKATISLSATGAGGLPTTTLRASTGQARLTALVLDAAGQPVPNTQVAFVSVAGRVSLGAPTAVSDAAGRASITLQVADASVTAADTVTATATVGGVTVQSAFVLQLLPDTPTVAVSVSPAGGTLSTTSPATVSVLVKDSSNNPVPAGTVVTVRSNFGLTGFDATSAATDASGIARFVVRPKDNTSNGADQLIVSTNVGGVTVNGQATVQVLAPGLHAVSLSLSSTIVTIASPANLTVIVRDAAGTPVSGAVVDLSTVRGDVASLAATAVITGDTGSATVRVEALSGLVNGADQVRAQLRSVVGSGSEALIGFNVARDRPTVNLALVNRLGQPISVLNGAADGAELLATIRNAAGSVLPNTVVTFASQAGRIRLGGPSAVTDSNGTARITVASADPTVTAADTLAAAVVVEGLAVQGAIAVQLQPSVPTLEITADVGTVTSAAPSTLSVTVRRANGDAVGAGTVVSIASVYSLTSVDAATALTDAGGIARFRVLPRTATSNGAEELVVSATVEGVTVSRNTQLQVLATVSSTVVVDLASATVTPGSPVQVTATVRDLRKSPLPGTLVDFSQLRGNLASLNLLSAVTDSNGIARVQLSANGSGLSGADQVIATVRGAAVATQGAAAFTVASSAPKLIASLDLTTLRVSAPQAVLTLSLRDTANAPVPRQAIGLATTPGLLSFSPTSVVTDDSGQAVVRVTATNPGVSAAATITASSTVAGVAVQSQLSIQLLADQPTLTITGGSTASATQPAVLSVLVRDSAGASVPAGTLVQVASSFGLSLFDATTLVTNASGVASVRVAPATLSSNGADQIVFTATVGGVPARSEAVVQVSSTAINLPPTLRLSISPTAINSGLPGSVTAVLRDGRGVGVPGQVVSFSVVRGLARTSVATALTNDSGIASVLLTPATSTTAGADEVTATARYAGASLQDTAGFEVQATNVSLTSFTSAVPTLGAYGQTTLTLTVAGASSGSPVSISVSSSCVLQGKATLSPATFNATTTTVDLQYKDNGCGPASPDRLQASIVGGSSPSLSLTLPIASPEAASLAFVSASPEVIFLRGSGFTETSTITFEVRDRAGAPLQGKRVRLSLLSEGSGLLIDGVAGPVTSTSDALGRLSVRINSGTAPTPVRVSATLLDDGGAATAISTVSSNLSVAVGLPSQLNFSLSQRTRNIEGFKIDGTSNTYSVILSDRSGNPVPTGTAINFVTEGGQIEAVAQTGVSAVAPIPGTDGAAGTGTMLSTAAARFQSASPRPDDGRITVTAYAIGEESFIDRNGNNRYDLGEPFQDLGDVYKDRLFDADWDLDVDETIPLRNPPLSATCVDPAGFGPVPGALLRRDGGLPSRPSTCDGVWSGPGGSREQSVYVRRSVETVLSTSAARALWASKSGLDATCTTVTLQNGPQTVNTDVYTPVRGGETWYGNGGNTLTLPFIVADANTFPSISSANAVGRLNPMAAGTTVTASSPTTGLVVRIGGGSPVPNTTEASAASVGVTFESASSGVVFVTFTSPSGLATTYTVFVTQSSASKPSSCP